MLDGPLGVTEKAGEYGPAGPLSVSSTSGWEEIFGLPTGSITANDMGNVFIAMSIYCADVKARDIGVATLEMWRRTPTGGRVRVKPSQHWFAELLARGPTESGEYTWYELVGILVHHIELMQEAFLVKRIVSSGRTLELIPVMPTKVSQQVNVRARQRYYDLLIGTDFENMMLHGIKKRLPAEQMVHIRGRMIDVFRVTSNTEMCRGAYALIAAIKNYQTKLFRNFGRHALSFETAEIFGAGAAGEAAFRRLKAQLATGVHKLAEDNVPLLLEAGLSAKTLSMNADDTKADAALLQAQYDICRAHGVPPHKVGLPIIGTYENKQTLEEEYPRSALIPVCTMIERRIEMDVFSERDRRLGYFIEFDRDAIMLASTTSVNTRIEVGMKTATLKVDEAREMMRRNPIGGKAGTARLAPANMQMVGDNNEVLLKAQQAASAGKQDAGDQTGNNETTPGT